MSSWHTLSPCKRNGIGATWHITLTLRLLSYAFDFMMVIRAAEEMTPLASVGLPGDTVFIEHRFPLSIVYTFLSD